MLCGGKIERFLYDSFVDLVLRGRAKKLIGHIANLYTVERIVLCTLNFKIATLLQKFLCLFAFKNFELETKTQNNNRPHMAYGQGLISDTFSTCIALYIGHTN